MSELINSIETDYEQDDIHSISTLLDPRFKQVPLSASALDRIKKLLLILMRRVNLGGAHGSKDNSINVITDNEDAQVGMPEKKTVG